MLKTTSRRFIGLGTQMKYTPTMVMMIGNGSFKSYHSSSFKNQMIVGVSGMSVEGLVFSLALSKMDTTSKLDVYSSANPIKDEACVLSEKTLALLNDYCDLDLKKSAYVKELSHYHLIRADIRNPITVMDLSRTTPPALYSIQKSYLIKLLNERLAQKKNIALFNDNIRTIGYHNGRISLATKKSITKRYVDLLVGAEEDVQSSSSLKYLQGLLGSDATVKSRCYEVDTAIIPCPSDIDYEARIFEWWNNSSRLAVIPLPNNQLGLNSIQYIPKHSALGFERNGANSLQFILKIHSNLRDNGIDSVLDYIKQLFYSRDRVGIAANSQVNYEHELSQLYAFANPSDQNSPCVVAIGNVAHCVDPTIYQGPSIAIQDAIQLAIHLKEHGLSKNALDLYQQESKLNFERIHKYSEGLAGIGFKKRVNKITLAFKFVLEKLNIMRFKRIIGKVNQ